PPPRLRVGGVPPAGGLPRPRGGAGPGGDRRTAARGGRLLEFDPQRAGSRRHPAGRGGGEAMSGANMVAVDPAAPEAEEIDRAAAILRAGGLVAFPTETVYGLGADGLNAAAVAQIFAVKGRPAEKGLILHLAEREAIEPLVEEVPEAARRLIERFTPG